MLLSARPSVVISLQQVQQCHKVWVAVNCELLCTLLPQVAGEEHVELYTRQGVNERGCSYAQVLQTSTVKELAYVTLPSMDSASTLARQSDSKCLYGLGLSSSGLHLKSLSLR